MNLIAARLIGSIVFIFGTIYFRHLDWIDGCGEFGLILVGVQMIFAGHNPSEEDKTK
jgi:hypothetical protein